MLKEQMHRQWRLGAVCWCTLVLCTCHCVQVGRWSHHSESMCACVTAPCVLVWLCGQNQLQGCTAKPSVCVCACEHICSSTLCHSGCLWRHWLTSNVTTCILSAGSSHFSVLRHPKCCFALLLQLVLLPSALANSRVLVNNAEHQSECNAVFVPPVRMRLCG